MTFLIHTGGTIGMAPGPGGLVPEAGRVEAAVGDRARITAFSPLLDSAAITFHDWNRMLDLIDAEPGPVVLTHGTDTMTFTGAALAQALAGRRAPVVMTGAMVPLGSGGDAEGNLDLALRAAETAPPGVWLAFAGQILPAGGLVKHDTHSPAAFRAVPQAGDAASPPARRFADRRLAILTVGPGLPGAAVAAALAALDGAVLRVFGTGTLPPDPALAQALAHAVAAGRPIRAVSQCETGGLAPGTYAAGAALWSAGVENGGTETAEAALIRLWLRLSA